MILDTGKLCELLENEYPIGVIGIDIKKSGVRVQYREKLGDENLDSQLRETQLKETVNTFIKRAVYMSASNLDSKLMLRLESSDVDTVIQRIPSTAKLKTAGKH